MLSDAWILRFPLCRLCQTASAAPSAPPASPAHPGTLTPYPNPFRGVATIPVDLDGPSDVSIRVYNVLGQVVRTLTEGQYPSGHHDVSFKAGDLPPELLSRLHSSDYMNV